MSGEDWKHEHAQLPGVRLHYVTQGDGPLVVLLHGFPEFWYSWRHQIPALAQRFRVVVPDLRGYGQSEKPAGVRNYTLASLTGDVLALIRHCGHEKAHIVGHDWGGALAWAFAAQHPQATARLAVLNCPPVGQMRRHLLTNLRQLARSWYIFFFQLPFLPERAILSDPRRFARRTFRGAAVHKEAFGDEELRRYAEAIALPGAATAALNYYRAAFRAALWPRGLAAPSIPAPTLVIWGEQDPSLGTELTRGLERYVSGPLQVHPVPDSGHWVQQERPELVNRLLLDFLSDAASEAPPA
jgi:pimeloyl-ACP methyl ester carboxylesterase